MNLITINQNINNNVTNTIIQKHNQQSFKYKQDVS